MSLTARLTAPTAEAATQEEASYTFFPWPLPAALLLSLGVALAYHGFAWWLVLLLAGTAVMSGWLFGRGQLALHWLLFITLLLPLGFWRYSLWEAQPHVLAPLMAQRLTLTGESDGRYLRVHSVDGSSQYRGARVVLSPSGSVEPGQVTLVGDLREAQGKRNPGGFDYRGYLERRGVRGQVFVREVLHFEPARLSTRERLRQGVVAGLGERPAALMQAMTLGVRDNLGDLRDIFAASGLAHILALSGLHVGVLMGAAGLLLRPLGRLRYPLMIAFVIFFVLLVGATPSVVRAGAMVTAVLLTLWLGSGRMEPWPALGLAALFTLLWNPSWLFDISFQLSYLAVAGILIFVGPVMKAIFGRDFQAKGWWDPRVLVIGAMVVSASAQVLTLPLIAHAFGNVPLFSPLVNVLAIPLATLLVPLGFLAGVVGTLSLPLAGLMNSLTGLLAASLIGLADLASNLPGLPWGEIGSIGFGLYAVAAAALALTALRLLRPWRGALVVMAVMASSSLLAQQQTLELVFLDVGQGDSALIRLGDANILVDGGGSVWSDFDVGARTVVPALRALGVRRLELVVATHAHVDHMEGLISVLELVPVGALVIGAESWDREVFVALMAAAERRGVEVVRVNRGESLTLGSARLDILNPPKRRYDEVDSDSVAFALHLDDVPRALFLGDIPAAVEADIAFPNVDILMLPHHGSRSSSSEALLRAAQPEVAVVSYGRNNYGHPHPTVLERLQAQNVPLRETFLEGAVRVPLGR